MNSRLPPHAIVRPSKSWEPHNASLPTIQSHIRVHSLDAALQARRFGLSSIDKAARVAIVLDAGRGHIDIPGQRYLLVAPSLAWFPFEESASLHLDAGARGKLLMLSDILVRDAIGQSAESSQLRTVSDRATICNDIDDSSALSDLSHSVSAIKRELRSESCGSWNYLIAHIALILVQCWRKSSFIATMPSDGALHSAVLIRFRQLVEAHFRSRWRIADYANALCLSHDRLHDICSRALARTPLELLHDRVFHEASLRLARSDLSIEALADHLGFHSTSHFSRFFKQHSGATPAKYRKLARELISQNETLSAPAFPDWP